MTQPASQPDGSAPLSRRDLLRRRLTFADAMILVAAIAAAFALARAYVLRVMPGSHPAFFVRMTIVFVALALTIALIPLRLLRPRPCHIGRLPGFVACCAVALASAFILAGQANTWLQPLTGPERAEPNIRAINLVFNLLRLDLYSTAVAGSWLALALSGRWRPERDWIDRGGRALGACWIVSPFIAAWVP
jgi:hypothetical protein